MDTILQYTKTKQSGAILYTIGDKSYTLRDRVSAFDPVFLSISSSSFRVVLSEAKIISICSKFGIDPVPLDDGFGEVLPRGYVPPGGPLVKVDASYTEMIDRICPICGDYYNEINRCDLISGKHLICDRCGATNTTIPTITNVCGNCGLEYKSIVEEDFCSYCCEVKANEVKFVLPKFNGIISSYRDLEVVKQYDDIEIDRLFGSPVSNGLINNNLVKETLVELPPIKATSTIHRVCPDCGVVYETTRAMLKKNRGVLCKDHAKKHRVTPRVRVTCLNCGVAFDSIVREDYCCEECKNFSNPS